MDVQKDVLSEVFRFAVVTKNSSTDAERKPRITMEQRGQSLVVSRTDVGKQGLVR